MQKQNMSGWLQQTARRVWTIKVCRSHAGHYHSLKTIETKRDMTQTDDAGRDCDTVSANESAMRPTGSINKGTAAQSKR